MPIVRQCDHQQVPARQQHVVDLSPPEEESSIGRKLLRATVTIGPRRVFFYTTHFSTASGATLEERRLQAVQVRQQVQADTNGGSSTVTGIVTGDFNAPPDNPLVTEDMGSLFDDAWIAGENPPGGGLTGCYDGASEPTCRIDYIFYTRSSGFSPLRVVVDVDSSLSDHRPVLGGPALIFGDPKWFYWPVTFLTAATFEGEPSGHSSGSTVEQDVGSRAGAHSDRRRKLALPPR